MELKLALAPLESFLEDPFGTLLDPLGAAPSRSSH